MEINDIYNLLKSAFDEGIIDLKTDIPLEPFIIVDANKINAVSYFLRDERSLQFDFLNCLSGVDLDSDNLAVVYHMSSFVHKHKLKIKVIVPKSNPVVKSVYDVWATAEWHEREAYDLFGIIFEGNPDLRRILLPEDWEGYPLRKDYKVQEFYRGMRVPY
ncbi:MAG: NADH-quinone oxidoreductase subunit C [Ignavibacteria bacterium]|nr:NADH-quinone oxidoreductase subunit C [Ignavibacteria bacterium]